MKRKKILLAAGGSGGHLLPAQQLCDDLQGADLLFAGHGLESSPFFDRSRFSFRSIESAPLGKPIAFCCASICSTARAMRLLRLFNPDVVIGFGSYHAFPILAAAVLLRKRIVLFEPNCSMGKVIRLFAPFAHAIASQFPLQKRGSGKFQFCNDLKNELLVPLLPWKKREIFSDARKRFGLDPSKMTCLIVGGSQGASFLNRQIPSVLPSILQAIHLTGKQESVEEVRRAYKQAKICCYVSAFEQEMEAVYQACDLAICRSGASTIAELIAHELPALLIPFPYSAGGHQIANAEFLAKKSGGATMLLERDADAKALSSALAELLERSESMRLALGKMRSECAGRQSLGSIIMGEG